MIVKQGAKGRLVKHIQWAVGAEDDGAFGPDTHGRVRMCQVGSDLDVDGIVGLETMALLFPKCPAFNQICMDRDVAGMLCYKKIGLFEGGGKWDALNPNLEFEGRFDHPGDIHWASKYGDTPTFIGASLALNQNTEKGGSLGWMLRLIDEHNPELGPSIFGDEWGRIVKGTNGKLKSGDTTIKYSDNDVTAIEVRVPRNVCEYDGGYLWQGPYPAKLREIARSPEGKAAQEHIMLHGYYYPAVGFCHEWELFGLTALTMTTDRFNGHGRRGGARLLTHLFEESMGWDEEARMLWIWHFAKYHSSNIGWPVRFGRYIDDDELGFAPVEF